MADRIISGIIGKGGSVIREIAARARCALDAKFAQTSGKSLVPRKVGPQVAHGDLPSKAVQLNQAWRASWSQAELRTACRLFDARVMARLRYTCDDANVSADSGRPPHARCDETVQKLAAESHEHKACAVHCPGVVRKWHSVCACTPTVHWLSAESHPHQLTRGHRPDVASEWHSASP